MDRADRDMFFALLRSAVCGGRLDESERWELSPRQLGALMQLGRRHDIAHLVEAAAKKEDLKLPCDSDRAVYTAVYRGGDEHEKSKPRDRRHQCKNGLRGKERLNASLCKYIDRACKSHNNSAYSEYFASPYKRLVIIGISA